MRFGEPVSLSAFLGPPGGPVATDPEARRLALAKIAFEVAWRINQGMPVTATALITTILLAMHGAALTFDQIRLALADALDYLSSRAIPRTASVPALAAAEPVRATLDALAAGGLVTCVADGREPVWLIGPDHQLAATFYRNSLIHFLLDKALCELAVLRASGADADPVAAFWAEIGWLRDLLKFEFYFKDRDEHRRQVREEMGRQDPDWEDFSGRARLERTRCWRGCGRWCPICWCGRSSRRTGWSPTCWYTTTCRPKVPRPMTPPPMTPPLMTPPPMTPPLMTPR